MILAIVLIIIAGVFVAWLVVMPWLFAKAAEDVPKDRH